MVYHRYCGVPGGVDRHLYPQYAMSRGKVEMRKPTWWKKSLIACFIVFSQLTVTVGAWAGATYFGVKQQPPASDSKVNSSDLPPDPGQIIALLGNPVPFSMKPGIGATIIIYSTRLKLTPEDTALLKVIKNKITELAGIQIRAVEFPVGNAAALGDLLTAIKSLNYQDIKVEAVGNDRIRAIYDDRVSSVKTFTVFQLVPNQSHPWHAYSL
jgi:hypothetical protein